MTVDTMTPDTLTPEALPTDFDTADASASVTETLPLPDGPAAKPSAEDKPKRAPAKRTAGKKAKTLELTLTVTGTADGEWRAELKQGSSYLARNLAVAAAAVSRAAKELHEDLSAPID